MRFQILILGFKGLNMSVRSISNWNLEMLVLRDLSEISRGGGGVGILNLGSEIRWPTPAMRVKFANPPLELGLKYNDPPHLTQLNRVHTKNCNHFSRTFQGLFKDHIRFSRTTY